MLQAAIETALKRERETRPPGFGMSAIGHCKRQLAYMYHGVEGKPLDAWSLLVFKDGDRAHRQLRGWIKEGLRASKSCFRLMSMELEVRLPPLTGHVDGILKHNNAVCTDAMHEDMLLEVKSMNERSFKLFKDTKRPDNSYMAQISAYLRATGLKRCLILAKNKNTGEIFESELTADDALLERRIEACIDVWASKSPEDVEREYHANEKGYLPWNCGYCPFVQVCWRHEGTIQTGRMSYRIGGAKTAAPPATSAAEVYEKINSVQNRTNEVSGTENAKKGTNAIPPTNEATSLSRLP